MTDSRIDDATLSRRLTEAVRAVDGVAGVYPARPPLEAAAEAVAVSLDLRRPDALVDIDRADGFTTVTAHIATVSSSPAPATARAVGELLRRMLGADASDPDAGIAVNVKVRLIEDAAPRA